ncbi:MAG: CapA family protein [Clostridia bacterium]|nr:CapA family protein [Clostridia bacterium]
MNKRLVTIIVICILLVTASTFLFITNSTNAKETIIKSYTMNEYVEVMTNKEELAQAIDSGEIVEYIEEIEKPIKTHVVMNFAGDCTLGADSNFGYKTTFFEAFDNNSYDYFFSNMQSLFANDDLTVVNLEGTFTDYMVKTPKLYNFRASPEYANILLSGDIDVVNIANNHTRDYGQKGYDDTIQTLKDYNIPFFGYDNYYIYEKDGIKIGFAGMTSIGDSTINKRIDYAMLYFEENNCDAEIITFHWGNERVYQHNVNQQRVGRYAIDKGADLVVGHHSHVIQDIEEYNGKYIVYSLSNFCFGGNTNPPDKDTFVFNTDFEFEDGELIKMTPRVYPARVSSVNNRNDYKPTLAEGEEYIRILNKINKYSNVEFGEDGYIK